MLETLTRGFGAARERLAGIRELTEQNVDEALREVRTSLLEADVDFALVRDFLARVKQRALGEKVATRTRDAAGRELRVSPGQHFVAICEQELVALMGPVDPALARDARGATSIMLLGLQGVGKTTIAAKLARQDLGQIALDEDDRRELVADAELEMPLVLARIAVLAPVRAAPVGIERPAERHAGGARERRTDGDLLIARLVGPFVYVRFHGASGNYQGSYEPQVLQRWADRLVEEWKNGRPVYAYFNNDPGAVATRNARTLGDEVGKRIGMRGGLQPAAYGKLTAARRAG